MVAIDLDALKAQLAQEYARELVARLKDNSHVVTGTMRDEWKVKPGGLDIIGTSYAASENARGGAHAVIDKSLREV